MLRRVALLLAAASVFGLVVPAADAALTKDQLKCQSAVAKKGRVFFKKRLKALTSCHDAIAQGKLPTTTDCTLEPGTQAKIDKAEQKLRDKIEGSCPDATVAGLSFGGECFGVVAGTALAECAVAEHEAATDLMIDLAYNVVTGSCVGGANTGLACNEAADCPGGACFDVNTVGTCDGGANDGLACNETSDCPSGACVWSKEQSFCARQLSNALGKLSNKRQGILQKCKKSVAAGKLPESTDCIAEATAKLDAATSKAITAIRKACPSTATAALAFGGTCEKQSDPDAVAACGTCSAGRATDDLILVQHGSSARGASATVQQISDANDCVGGPLSRCRVNDYLLANDRIRVVVQDVQRNLFSIGQFGGQIIDADVVRTSGPDRDNFEEWALSLNIESTAHYTSLTILNDGSNGGPAILRATGVDDLLDFINPSSTVAGFGFPLPASADDTDLPVAVTTDYILEPGTNYVRVETTVHNLGALPLSIFFGEYIGGSGQIEMFQPGYGFGEPLVSTPCSRDLPNLCNFTAFSGEDGADGVSYGYVHEIPGSTTFTTSGVHVPQLNVEIILALIGAAAPPFTIEAAGNPDDAITLTRWFVVGEGSVSDIADARNEIHCVPTARVQGTVTAGGNPAARADVAVLGALANGPTLLSRNVVVHTRTDDNGNYSFTLPPGTYDVVANLDGYPYEGGGSTPTLHPITVAAFETATENFALPATGALEVAVVDENAAPVPAKVSVVGFDPSPDLAVTQSIFGLINNRTNTFGDRAEDGLPFGLTKVAFLDQSGALPATPLEPGNYQVYVSRGPEYSLDSAPVTITAGATTPVSATVERVVDSTGFISGDFHVHSIDSPDSEVTRVERVISMLAEGVDFFASTDHDYRAEFQPTIDALGATALIGTAVGQETTTFDYGHFNVWPVVVDPSQVNFGGIDHGGVAPDGLDYPSSGFYNEPPVNIIAAGHADAPGASNTVQVNHIHSAFGADGGSGLAIDTGLQPPASTVPAAARRLDPGITNFFTDTMDALEIWIGDDRSQINANFLGQNAGDWFNLINQGIVRTAVANSDTHSRITGVSGFPRTMIAMPTDDPGDLSALADTMSANLNEGRVFGTNAPVVRVAASAASTGQTASLELGMPLTISTVDGAVEITVDVQSPEWAEFDTIEFYVNPVTTRVVLPNVQTGAGLINVNRYTITPTHVHTAGVDFAVASVPAPGTSSNRLEASTTLSLAGLTEDIWVVVMVKGTDGVSRPLFPVLPNSLATAGNNTLAGLTDGNLGENGVTALAFTNPLFIDVDGGGWTPPGVQVNP